MKATLYEALGILPTSSDEEVRAALRRVIRKYYAKWSSGRQARITDLLARIWHTKKHDSQTPRNEDFKLVPGAGLEPAPSFRKNGF